MTLCLQRQGAFLTVCCRLFPILLFVLAACVATLFPAPTTAQIPDPPIAEPDGGSKTVEEGQSGLTVNFEVESQSSFSENFSLSCGHTGDVDDCSVQSSVTIGAYVTEVVHVTYATGDPGSGTVRIEPEWRRLPDGPRLGDMSGWFNLTRRGRNLLGDPGSAHNKRRT